MIDATDVVARRSCLSVPGSSLDKLAKAAELGADEVVIDLEDAVAVGAKDDARKATAAALEAWPGAAVAVRVNAPRTPWCHLDLAAVAQSAQPPGSIVVPKVESAGDLAFVDRFLDGLEAAGAHPRPLRVQALIETAAGLARVGEIVTASERLDALILGYADLATSLGRREGRDSWEPARHALLVAARAQGLQAIDGPYLGVALDDGFHSAATRARDLGFDGKWAIHPSQVPVLNELFRPSDDEVRRARAIVAALERSRRAGAGAAVVDGQMVDEAVAAAARRVLALVAA
jgi:citrate lyase subunit beta/citryl-CoA lyase